MSLAKAENTGRVPDFVEGDGGKKEKEEHELFLRPVSIKISRNHLRGHIKLIARCIGLDLRAKFSLKLQM